METPTILNTGGDNAALIAALANKNDGTALGGMGGLIAGALLAGGLGNGGLFGNRHGGIVENNFVTADQLQTAVGTITDNAQNNSVLEGLSDIKAAVPLAEGQVQLALAGAVGEVRTHIGQVENGVLLGQAAINKNISEAIAASLASQNNINTNVLQTSTQVLMAVKDSQYATLAAVTADGEKTRALITANQIADLQRLAAERQDEIIELRNEGRRRDDRHGVEVTMINNQNQNQLQFQQQAQVLSTLTHALVDVSQVARATNQAINIGGTQLASPTNSATNVRA